MNIENITTLAEQLEVLGFTGLKYDLLRKVCFKPLNFVLEHKVDAGNDKLDFEIYFEKLAQAEMYQLKYYEATLNTDECLRNMEVSSVEITALEKSFAEIDWAAFFNPSTAKSWSPDNKNSWETERKVESIIDQLNQLEKTAEGKAFANKLKLKFWWPVPYRENYCLFNPVKSKKGFVQRFYFFAGQPGISVSECARFLLHQKMTKQLVTEKKGKNNFAADDEGVSKKLKSTKRQYKKNVQAEKK